MAYVVQHHQLPRPPALVIANGIEDPIPRDCRDQLLQEQHQQHPTNQREVEVMDLEQAVQLQRLPLLHQLPPAEDDDVVGDEGGGRLGHAGHGRLAGDEVELLGLVAAEGGEGFGEDGPEGDAEGAVESWQADF